MPVDHCMCKKKWSDIVMAKSAPVISAVKTISLVPSGKGPRSFLFLRNWIMWTKS